MLTQPELFNKLFGTEHTLALDFVFDVAYRYYAEKKLSEFELYNICRNAMA